MRWPFGRRSTTADGPARRPALDERSPMVDRPRDAWRSLPAVQRTVGEPPVVAPAAPFADALATRQAPDLALAPLGHEVSSLAGPGLVIGVATPAGATNSGRIELPLQRRAEVAEVAGRPEAVAWSSFPDPVQAQIGERPASSSGAAPSLAPVVVQRLAGSALLLTSSAVVGVGASPPGRLDLRPAGSGARLPAGEMPIVQRATSTPDVPPLGRSTLIQATVGPANEQAAAAAALPTRRPTLGEARRLGLGAPLRVADGMHVQRLAEPGHDRTAPGPVLVDRVAAHLGGLPAGGQVELGDDEPISAEASGVSGQAVRAGPSPELAVVQPLSIQRLPTVLPAMPSRVIAGAPPIDGPRPNAPGFRGGPAGAGGSGRRSPTSAPGAPVAASRLAASWPDELPAHLPASVDPSGATVRFTSTSPIGGAPIRATSGGSLVRTAAKAGIAAAESATPAQGGPPGPVVARSIDGPGDPSTTSRSGLEAQLAGLGVTVHHAAAGPLVQRLPTSAGSAAEPAPAATGDHPAVISIQRAGELPELQVPGGGAPMSGAAPVAADAGIPAAGAAPADRERELDDLARRLYGRIRSRLASELLVDRERAGMITDLR